MKNYRKTCYYMRIITLKHNLRYERSQLHRTDWKHAILLHSYLSPFSSIPVVIKLNIKCTNIVKATLIKQRLDSCTGL